MAIGKGDVEFYDPGEIIVQGKKYNSDLIICPDKILNNWSRSNLHSLSINDLQMIIAERPAKLIIGSGQNSMLQIPEFTQSKLSDLGFDVYIAKTRNAVTKYNETCKEEKTIGVFCIK